MTSPNYDYDLEQGELQRRMKVAEAMMQGGIAPLGPTEFANGVAVKKSPLEALAKIAQAYFGAKQVQTVNDSQRDLTSRYRGDLKSGVSDLVEGLSSTAGNPTSIDDESGGHTGPAMTALDVQAAKRRAILNAVGSNVPPVQAMGTSLLSTMIKQDEMTQKDWLALADKFDPESVVAAQRAQNPQLLKPKKTVHAVNGQLVSEQGGGNVQPMGDFRDRFGPVGTIAEGPGGPVVGQTNTSTGEAKFAPGGTNINLNTTQKAGDAFATGLAGDRAKMISDSYAKARDLPQTMATLTDARAALDAGIKSGTTADMSLSIAKLADKLGFGQVDPTIANSEEFRAKMATTVLDKIKILRPASDNDVKYAKEASGADLKLSLQALQHLVDSGMATAVNTYRDHMNLVEKAQGTTGALPQDLEQFKFDMPYHLSADRFNYSNGRFSPILPEAAPGGKPTGPMSLEQYLKSKGVR